MLLKTLLVSAISFHVAMLSALGILSLASRQVSAQEVAKAPVATVVPSTVPTAIPTAIPTGTVAQPTGVIITSEGISNDVDKKHRGPLVSVGVTYSNAASEGGERAKILVDASVPNEEYQKYPIRVDFYINRTLFTSQVRSTELPGPLGIEVTAERAKVPFNYSIVATLLHPNREFTTVINGAVFANNLNATLSTCELTITAVQSSNSNSSRKSTYAAKEVQVSQSGNNAATIELESSELTDGSAADTIRADALINFSGTSVSGTVTTTIDERSQASAVTGTGASGDSGVTSFAVASADGFTKLACR